MFDGRSSVKVGKASVRVLMVKTSCCIAFVNSTQSLVQIKQASLPFEDSIMQPESSAFHSCNLEHLTPKNGVAILVTTTLVKKWALGGARSTNPVNSD